MLLFSSVAYAQEPYCGNRAAFIEELVSDYAERPVAMGITERGGVIEVFASASGTWTFLLTMPNGLTCMVASGEGWETLGVEYMENQI